MLFGYLALNFAVLWIVARASASNGLRLVGMLFVLAITVGSLNSMVEAVFFQVLTVRDVFPIVATAAIIFAVLSPIAVIGSGRLKSGAEAPLEYGAFTPLTLAGCVVAYELLYWAAGLLVFPWVAHFYAGRVLPPGYAVAMVQVVRALIFVGAAYPLLRVGLKAAPLVLALVYAIIGGLAPMLPDNPFMPADIRLYHGIEVTLSNFLFGLAVGALFYWRKPAAAQA